MSILLNTYLIVDWRGRLTAKDPVKGSLVELYDDRYMYISIDTYIPELAGKIVICHFYRHVGEGRVGNQSSVSAVLYRRRRQNGTEVDFDRLEANVIVDPTLQKLMLYGHGVAYFDRPLPMEGESTASDWWVQLEVLGT